MARPTEQRSVSPTCSRIARLDAHAEVERRQQRPLAAHQPAGHLVDGADGGHGHAALHGFNNAVVILGVELVAAPRPEQCSGHMRLASATMVPVLHAEGLGLVAGGDAAGGVGHHRHHAHGPAAQLGPHLLLHRGKVGVQVDEEPVERRILFDPAAEVLAAGSVEPLPKFGQIRKLLWPLLGNG